ncbi:MAG TPA: D-glycero-beta-D-manno-heptose 1,7-bisphosphate 7-phosphatase [Caldithrix abyssi]|uniref:D,D-heptose 1,7-bisphosphate phosphatase n=1 Tax=Caldithrix abyssi TaxID=187145 RepID=A0A7V4TXW1_CALAY|nr:D-glycero-beta-D-manno-heptose 1,7-bisphosphate 7-phosphatase [Caldithrix abyssi]
MNKAVFLDRDGTINEEMGYINHISRFVIFDFVPEAIRILNEGGFKVVVVTNQSGVARGYFDEQLVKEVHKKLIEKVEQAGAHIDGIYYCPHHPREGKPPYRLDCECRKPKTGMIQKAKDALNIDINRSFIIGDRYKDIEFGYKAGLRPVMVLTGYGRGEYMYQQKQWQRMPEKICANLLEAVQWIIKQDEKNN